MSHSTTIKTVPISNESALRACVAELKQKGIDVELKSNAIPRMYYRNQIARQIAGSSGAEAFEFNSDPDVCDWVLEVKGSHYDIGLLRNADGSGYTPVFDDYTGGPTYNSNSRLQGLKDILGNKYDGKVEHWSGNREDNEGSLFSIGKFLAGYTKHATIQAATLSGHMVESCIEDEETGAIELVLAVN